MAGREGHVAAGNDPFRGACMSPGLLFVMQLAKNKDNFS